MGTTARYKVLTWPSPAGIRFVARVRSTIRLTCVSTPLRAPVATQWVLAGIPLAVVATLAALASSGASAPSGLGDPGALVRWGGPVVSTLNHLAAAATLGGLVLLLAVLPAPTKSPSSVWRRTAAVLAWVGPSWAVLNLLDVLMRYAQAVGRPLGGAGFGGELGFYLTGISTGRMALTATILVALAALGTVALTSYRTAILAAIPGFGVLMAWASRGHAASASGHEVATSGMWMHLMGVAVWVGALAVLAWVGRWLGPAVPAVLRRFSAIALWCYVLVGISGIASAWIRLSSPTDLTGPYGRLIVVKIVVFTVLGAIGWWHRSRIIPALDEREPSVLRRAMWRLIGGEVVLMGSVIGVSSALAVTSPPIPIEEPTQALPAEEISGRSLPPAPDLWNWVTQTVLDPLFVVVLLAMAGLYIAGVVRLRRRGVQWPIGRMVWFLLAIVVLAWAVAGGAAVYGRLMFSAHMIGHMTLAMVAPIGLVLGAPMTLALRALAPRKDGTRGPREWLLIVLHSKVGGFIANPVVAAVNFAASMILFYFTPLFEWALVSHLGHILMNVHFVGVGYLFINALIGIDPGPKRPSHALRLVLLFATMAFHAFFGVALMQMNSLLAADYFGFLGLPWGVDALADQTQGAAITWGLGEIPVIAIAVAVALSWYRDDTREARRKDRAADRDGDAELKAYNEMLGRLGKSREDA